MIPSTTTGVDVTAGVCWSNVNLREDYISTYQKRTEDQTATVRVSPVYRTQQGLTVCVRDVRVIADRTSTVLVQDGTVLSTVREVAI